MHHKKIGEYLVEDHVCNKQAISNALDTQLELKAAGTYKPLGRILIDDSGNSVAAVEQCLQKMHLEVLAKTPIFKDLSPGSPNNIVSIAEQQVFPEGAVLVSQALLSSPGG